jgi:hypothetical protein
LRLGSLWEKRLLKKLDSGKEAMSGWEASKLWSKVVPDRAHPTRKSLFINK